MAFAPKTLQSRKKSFKVAAPVATVERDTSVLTWSGDCGLVDIIGPDDLVRPRQLEPFGHSDQPSI